MALSYLPLFGCIEMSCLFGSEDNRYFTKPISLTLLGRILMSRLCPSCGIYIPMRGLVRRPAEKPAPWFKLSRGQFYCPKCGAQIFTATRPFGYAIIILLIAIGFFMGHPDILLGGFWIKTSAVIASIFLFLMLVVCLAKWGISFSTHEKKSQFRN